MPTIIATERQFAATLVVAGVTIPESFDQFSGGGIESDAEAYSPGGMVPSVVLGAPSTVEDVELERAFDLARDLPLVPRLRQWVIDSAAATVIVQYYNRDRVPAGAPLVFAGLVKGVSVPELDSTGNSAAKFTVTVAVGGV